MDERLVATGRCRHVMADSSIMRPFFGEDCTEWRVDLTDSRGPPSDDIGREKGSANELHAHSEGS
jgi:hypothetical protein